MIRRHLQDRPALVRVAPFLIFLGLTLLQGRVGEESEYWVYAGKTVVGALMVVVVWPYIKEWRWRFSWEAAAAGAGVAVIWIGLDPFYPKLSAMTKEEVEGWNPFEAFSGSGNLAWLFVVVRLVGSVVVVPPLEEAFYRSFVYRYVVSARFEEVSLKCLDLRALVVTSLVFGLAHNEWLAGILCGLIYQWLVWRRGDLGDAMVAHGLTNLLLGIWVVWQGAWHFW